MVRARHVYSIALTVLVLTACGWCGEGPSDPTAPAGARTQSILALKAQADKLLASGDSVMIRRSIENVFALVDGLIKSGQEDDAFRYLSNALTHDPWALDYQLLLAEMLLARGQSEPAREKAQLVVQYAEKDKQVNRARKLLQQDPLPAFSMMTSIPADTVTLVLVPVGEVDACVLSDLQRVLQVRLALSVLVRDVRVWIPRSRRDRVAPYLSQVRERLREGMKKDERLAAFLLTKDIRPEDLERDAELVKACRAIALASGGVEELAKFDANLAQLRQADKQWDIDELLNSLRVAAAPFRQPNLCFLGILNLDAFADQSNFIFGTAETNGHHAVVTYRRFTGEFNGETPSRKRLVDRLLKQSLSSVGFMLGVPRCATPTCARAYPHTLQEHDAKSTELCSACRSGFERALGVRLPRAEGAK